MDHDQITQTAAEYFEVAKNWLMHGAGDVITKATGESWYSNRPIKDSFHNYEMIAFNEDKALLEGLPFYGMF